MPITFELDRVRNLTILSVRGDISAEELRFAVNTFWQSPALSLNLIWDLREAEFGRLKYHEMDTILFHTDAYADRFRERETGKTAMVVNHDGQFDMLCQLSNHAAIQCLPILPKIFKTMGEAVAWIDQTEYDFITALQNRE